MWGFFFDAFQPKCNVALGSATYRVHVRKKLHRSDGDEPDSEGPTLERITRMVEAGEFDRASASLADISEHAADRPEFHTVQGVCYARMRRFQDAIKAFETAVRSDSEYLAAWHYLAELRETMGDLEGALRDIDRILEIKTTSAHHLARRIVLLAELGRTEAAETAAEAAKRTSADPAIAVAHGLAVRRAGRPREALFAQQAVLHYAPNLVFAWTEKGAALFDLGRFQEALAAYERALANEPNNIPALNGAGLANIQLGMGVAALGRFDRVLELQPWHSEALFFRAIALKITGELEESVSAFRELLQRAPDNALAHNNLGDLYRRTGRLVDSVDAFRRALELQPENALIHSNLLYTLLSDPRCSALQLFEEHRTFGKRFGQPASRYHFWANNTDPERPLRIGISSSELKDVALSNWLLPAIESLDRADFQLVCYANQHGDDSKTQRFKDLATGWRDVIGMSDEEMAEAIRADGIDVLIDIEGHTAGHRLGCFALHPAPVQAHWLGYPSTTGLEAIDYIIMDPIAVRPGEEHLFVERVIRLPINRFSYDPPDVAPNVSPPPVVENGYVTFASFNALHKLTDEVLEAWRQILLAVPQSRLKLKTFFLDDPAIAAQLLQRFCAGVIAKDRVSIAGPESRFDFLTRYAEVDIALDPFPFAGGASTCDALWMGLPVVTLPGWQVVSRQSETCLAAIGRSEWVAVDKSDYVRKACELSASATVLADMRSTQRENMKRSSLCDKAQFGTALNTVLRTMWRTFATSSPP